MTQTEKSSRKVISGVGWVNPLTHDYRIDQAAHAHVFADAVELVQGVDYTVSNVSNDAGYVITITNAGAWAPTSWVLDARPAIDQGSNLSVGGQFGTPYEQALDKLTRRVQRVYDIARRGLKTRLQDAVVDNPYTLPEPTATQFLRWNAAGTDLENGNVALLGGVVVRDDVLLTNNSSIDVPSEHAVKTYADALKMAKAANLSDVASVPTSRKNIVVGTYVADRAALKALDTTKDAVAELIEGSRKGAFIWTTGDFSTQIAADTQEGIYVKANAVAATAGAWVRVYDGPLQVEWFGASSSATGAANATAINAALSLASFLGGGAVEALGRYTVSGADITVPNFVTLRGSFSSSPGIYGTTWLATAPAILLDRLQTIKLNNASMLEGLLITPSGVTATQTSAQVAAWTGIAVTLLDGGTDEAVRNCTIIGYQYAVKQQATSAIQRARIQGNNIDCLNGILINAASDMIFIERNFGFPFASLNAPAEADSLQLIRSGRFVETALACDWPRIKDNFCIGYNIGYLIKSNHASVIGNGADYLLTAANGIRADAQIGIYVTGNPNMVIVKDNQTAAQQQGIYIDTHTGDVLVDGNRAWGCTDAIYHNQGRARIINNSVFDSATVGSGVKIIANAGVEAFIDNNQFRNLLNGIVQASAATPVHIGANNVFDTVATPVTNPYKPSIASAAALPVNGIDTFFEVTGSVGITSIAKAKEYTGKTITLRFVAALVMTHSAALYMAGAQDLNVGANTVIEFVSDGTNWYQVSNSGDYLEVVVASGAAVALTNSTPANMASAVIPAGDWDVDIVFDFTGGATTTVAYLIGSLSLTSATVDLTLGRSVSTFLNSAAAFNGVAGNIIAMGLPPLRLNLAAPTTVYAVVQAGFATSTCSAFGIIRFNRRK